MPVDYDTIVRVQMKDRTKLAAYIWTIVRDEHIVEDVMQDVYLLSFTKADQIEDEKHLPLWMRRTARLKALRHIRDRSNSPMILSQQALDQIEKDWKKLDREDSTTSLAALRNCVNTLTPRAKKIIKLRYIDGMKSAGIAEMLGQKVESVYVTISRIHRTLGECIRKQLRQKGLADE